jgi:tRNA dimethylallyltransferase
VIGLLGPTGVGKTAVAAELARLLGTVVISCDSMQIYRGFPVLTNQPSAGEREVALHELIDCVDPWSPLSAAEYAALALPLVERELARAGWAVLAGGTGLYLRAALAPLAVGAPREPALRTMLEERAAAEGAGALHTELARLDPEAARAIDPRNVRRVVRALEAVRSGGRRWSGRDDLWNPVYHHPTLLIGLCLDRTELYRHIDVRAAQIVDGGAVEEVRGFRQDRGWERTLPGGEGIRSAIGYPEICRLLAEERGRLETVDDIAGATRRYARRQLTWLRKLEGAVMMDVSGRDALGLAREIAGLAAGSAGSQATVDR